ncbi:MAG: glycosyltransferase [Chthoniobacterales bacterium]|nr:glycosyltransferase [Chthoniobacterales bacterium]
MLVVLTSHPIQYQAPLWRALADYKTTGPQDDGQGGGVLFEVWFLTDQGVRRTEDKDFGKAFAWDVDLLSGYPHRFLELRGQWDMRKFNGIPLAKPIGASLREANATALWVEGWRFQAFWEAVSAAKKMGIPVFLRGETSDKIAERGGIFGLVRNYALHRLFRKVDYFLAIGQASRRFYLRHGVPARKLIDAPYGVDNKFFRSESGRIRGLRDYGTTGLKEEGARQEALGEGEERDREEDKGGALSAHFDREGRPSATDQETKRPRDEKERKGAEQRQGTGARGQALQLEELTGRREADDGDSREEAQEDLSLTNLKLKTSAEIRREWNIPLEAKVVMFCGKFVRKKRPVDVVRAAQVHQTTGPQDNRLTRNPWHLLFVGSGELGEKLRAACDVRFDAESSRCADHKSTGPQDCGTEQARGNRQVGGTSSSLEPRASSHARSDARPPASFAGFLNQSEIPKAYAVADVLVLPSEAWETWGLVVNEATAAGVPTVVSDQCGCSDDFAAKNPYTRVFPMGDIAALASAIEEVLALEAKPEDVSKFAEAFSPRITAEAVAERLEDARGEGTRDEGSGKVAAPRWTGGKAGRRKPERSEDSVRHAAGCLKRVKTGQIQVRD